MSPAESRPAPVWVWGALTVCLLAWNGAAARYATPFCLFQGYDGPQYQLLARNRLHGHYEVGGTSHTVRREGLHPMWRPGLVWLIQGLAPLAGSVRLAAALASALGTTLMEVALLWLAWRCFGWAAFGVVLGCLVLPITVAVHFLRLGVGQGPEPWATGLVLVGLAFLVEARRWRSWGWALGAGFVAGLSEWFRTGNLVLFLVPCLVYGLAAVRRRDGRGLTVSVAALASFAAAAATGSALVPSPVDKTAANLWANLEETGGIRLRTEIPGMGPLIINLAGLTVVPGTEETYFDFIVRKCRERTLRGVLADRAGEVLPIYLNRLGSVVAGGARGLRMYTGDWLFACFAFQIVCCLVRPGNGRAHSLALAGAGLAFYLGPVVLLQGNEPSHYLMVMVPFAVLVGAAGTVRFAKRIWAAAGRRWPALAERGRREWKAVLGLTIAPAVLLSAYFYEGALDSLDAYRQKAATEQARLDSLGLEGKRVACRSMGWFTDRNVLTVLLPYARVPQLESYVRANGLDGVLLWEDDPALFFRAMPYGSAALFDQAMRQSQVFGPPRVAGGWRWYPVRQGTYTTK